MEKSADKSLVSLLRNSVLLELTKETLTIGLQNTGLFTRDKRTRVENSAHEFFKREITISYQDSLDGIDDSVREKIEQERHKHVEAKKKAAAESAEVQKILNAFPKSKIKSIEVLEEKKDVQRS